MNLPAMIRIDGSQGEGGGQILRTALAFSILTGKPVHLTRIRAGRRNPGLGPQHLAGVLSAAHICWAEVSGAKLKSPEVQFKPGGDAIPGEYRFDISTLAGRGSAGAVTLLLQALLLPLSLADGPSRLTLRGGTHVAWSPPVHYLDWVLLPVLAQIGMHAHLELRQWGWYPKGGGEIVIDIPGHAHLKGIDLTHRDEPDRLFGLAAASNLPAHIPQRISARANNLLREAGLPPDVQPLRVGGVSTGTGIFLAVASGPVRAGFSALGARGKPSEEVAAEAVNALLAYTRQPAALDSHLPDQLLPALALAAGPSRLSTIEITKHTLTNIAVIRHFIDRPIQVEGRLGQPGHIQISGDAPQLLVR